MIPPVAFLIAGRYRERPPNRMFPYGHHRSTAIAFLVAAVALFGMGMFLLGESSLRLIRQDHPSIGTVGVFGHQLWLGWMMLVALAYKGIPAWVIGRMKIPLGKALHDKVLLADAHMNRADWLDAGAAAVGVVGIGMGLWWADAVAAIVISRTRIRCVWSCPMEAGARRASSDAIRCPKYASTGAWLQGPR